MGRLVVASFILVLLLTACGSRHNSLKDGLDNILPGGKTSSDASVVTAGMVADEQPRCTVDLSTLPRPTGALPFDATLEQKLARMESQFDCEVIPADGVMQEGVNYRFANQIIVGYHANLTVPLINAARQCIVKDSVTQLELSDGYTEKVTTVIPDAIPLECITSDPPLAATQCEASMLENIGYAAVSRYLASKYDVWPVKEVYCGCVNFVVLAVKPDVDELQLSTSIQTENNDIIRAIDPVHPIIFDSYEPRIYDKLTDDPEKGPVGSGIYREHNGPAYWNDEEDFTFYGNNNAQLSTSWFKPHWPHKVFPSDYPHMPGVAAGAFVLDTGVYGGPDEGLPAHPDLPNTADVIWPSWDQQTWPSIWMPVAYLGSQDKTYWHCIGAYWPETQDIWPIPAPEPPIDYFSDFNSNWPLDSINYHGTAVCGTVSARGLDTSYTEGVSGVLPYGRVFPFKMVTATSFPLGSIIPDYTGLEAAIRAIKIDDLAIAYVANCSWRLGWGACFQSPPLTAQLMLDYTEEHASANFVFVCSAGNGAGGSPVAYYTEDGTYQAMYPAAFAMESDHFVCAASSSGLETRSGYSFFPVDDSEHPDPCLANAVTISAITNSGSGYPPYTAPQQCKGYFGELYRPFGGTSHAAPLVTGVVAALQSFCPEMSASEIKQHIKDCGRYTNWYGEPLPPFAAGAPNYPSSADPACTVIPIIDGSKTIPWIDIKYPETRKSKDPNLPTPILQTIEIPVWGNIPRGYFKRSMNKFGLSLYFVDSLNQTHLIDGPRYGIYKQPGDPDYNELDPNIQETFSFDPDNFPGGQGKLYAVLDNPFSDVYSLELPVETYNSEVPFYVETQVLGTMAISPNPDHALGIDSATGEVHALWVSKSPIGGGGQVCRMYVNREQGAESFNFLDRIMVDELISENSDDCDIYRTEVSYLDGATGYTYLSSYYYASVPELDVQLVHSQILPDKSVQKTIENVPGLAKQMMYSTHTVDANGVWYGLGCTDNRRSYRGFKRQSQSNWLVNSLGYYSTSSFIQGILDSIGTNKRGYICQCVSGEEFIHNYAVFGEDMTTIQLFPFSVQPQLDIDTVLDICYIPGSSFVDALYTPGMVTRSSAIENGIDCPYTSFGVSLADNQDFTYSQVEECEDLDGSNPLANPKYHGYVGKAFTANNGTTYGVVYFSGNQDSAQCYADHGDIKIAVWNDDQWNIRVLCKNPMNWLTGDYVTPIETAVTDHFLYILYNVDNEEMPCWYVGDCVISRISIDAL